MTHPSGRPNAATAGQYLRAQSLGQRLGLKDWADIVLRYEGRVDLDPDYPYYTKRDLALFIAAMVADLDRSRLRIVTGFDLHPEQEG